MCAQKCIPLLSENLKGKRLLFLMHLALPRHKPQRRARTKKAIFLENTKLERKTMVLMLRSMQLMMACHLNSWPQYAARIAMKFCLQACKAIHVARTTAQWPIARSQICLSLKLRKSAHRQLRIAATQMRCKSNRSTSTMTTWSSTMKMKMRHLSPPRERRDCMILI